MKRFYIFPIHFVELALLLLALGCRASPSPMTPPQVIDIQSSATPTNAPPASSLTPVLTITSAPSSTQTETPSPTLTPRPEVFTPSAPLPRPQVEVRVLDLYRTNAGCRLPCWWGFSPGVTRWETAERFLETFVPYISFIGTNESFGAYVKFPVPGFFNYRNNAYYVRDGIIQEIDIEYIPVDATNYHLTKVLDDYGEPEEVWISTVQNAPGPLGLSMILFYPHQGFLAFYGTGATSNGTSIQACPIKEESNPDLILWSAHRMLTFQEMVKGRSLFNDLTLRSLREATGISTNDFYKTFKESTNKTQCFETPVGLWP